MSTIKMQRNNANPLIVIVTMLMLLFVMYCKSNAQNTDYWCSHYANITADVIDKDPTATIVVNEIKSFGSSTAIVDTISHMLSTYISEEDYEKAITLYIDCHIGCNLTSRQMIDMALLCISYNYCQYYNNRLLKLKRNITHNFSYTEPIHLIE